MIDIKTWKMAWALLDARERRNAWIVLAVIMLGAIASAAMVGSILPFLSVLSDPSRIDETPVFSWSYEYFGFTSHYKFLIMLGSFSFGVIFLASAIQIGKSWAVARFASMRMHSISCRLLSSYLGQSYEFFLDRHTGDMGPRVLFEANQVVVQFFRPAAELIAACMTTIAIIVLLLWIEPLIAIFSFIILGCLYGIVYLSVRRTLRVLGETRVTANAQRYRLANEALSGIKDIKLLGREISYIDRYVAPSTRLSRTEATLMVVYQVPHFALQALALGGIILLALVLVEPTHLGSQAALGGFLPVLGVFAFAGQRLMPELSKLYQSLSQLQAAGASVDAVYSDITLGTKAKDMFSTTAENIGLNEALVLDGISYSYPKTEHVGLRDISFTIQAGQKIGVVGTSGAGKTTLADVILGLLEPSGGRLLADGMEITRKNVRSWIRNVGYVPQDIFLTDASVAENIALGVPPDTIDHKRVREAASIAKIDNFIEKELPQGFETNIGERGVRLSGGQRQRIAIARALYNSASLIVFDEATSALDNSTEAEVMEAIDSLPEDKTVFMIAHRLSTVKQCDRIIVLEHGRIVGCGSWAGLMMKNETFRRIAQTSDVSLI